ncbi:hypothetical protein M9458_012205, partial [Cirrhinus mrigala]
GMATATVIFLQSAIPTLMVIWRTALEAHLYPERKVMAEGLGKMTKCSALGRQY